MSDTEFAPEARLITETGLDLRIAQMIEPLLQSMGYNLVRVRLSGQNGLTLQIMAERFDGTMTVEDCEQVSMAVSPVLDVEDPIDKAYHLEVSSPGIDRPLVRKSDFEKWIGHLLKCETSVIVDNRKRFRGKLVSASETGFTVERDQPGYGEELTVEIPYTALSEARLILTDDLIRDALKADKDAKAAAREAANENEEPQDD
ncbi:ribosome maturation factor RimP [Rhizobium sp. C1]|uniref:ribosome maturation factor RimP n=1 Tax=Rhizobium sp. C1 TaxID=1349799 RepID=UPI001E358EB0|nr:ribosome maturation factor RimP [Rhizobium sp. C1]MCD2178338.1 ribosome maturation factor RimP [Rhizobium sp. C1]